MQKGKRNRTERTTRGLAPLDVQVAIRVPPDAPERAGRLAELLAAVPGALPDGRATRSAVMREAMLLGLAELERRHGGKGKRGRRA